nr:hypothetical protein [Tanacetum cinerariifolium]
MTKKKPNLNYLKVWGCRIVVRLPDPNLKTLGEKGIEYNLVGYVEHSKAFRFYVIKPNDPVSINIIIESKDAIFDDNGFSSVPRLSQRSQKEAINDKIDSIMSNNTWEFADLPPGCKWIFKRKIKVDGSIEKFKARLVIQGFKQKSRIDYFDTSAPMARINTIRLLVAITLIRNLIVHQMHVKTTFLNGKLEEDVCMNQPNSFIMPVNGNKDTGEDDVILSIRIKHESNGLAISQSYYIEKVLKKFNYFQCTSVSTPMDTIKKLMPDNGHVVSQLKSTSNPNTHHWQAIHRVLKYLKKTMDYRLTYTGYPLVLEGYTHAS